MALTRNDLIEMAYDSIGIPKKECNGIIDSFFEIIKAELEEGNSVMISGFGKWSVKKKGQRRRRNPWTGEEIVIKARKVVDFKCAHRLRGAVENE